MKVTKKMIDAGCHEAPSLERSQVSKIVNAALTASMTDSSPAPIWKGIAGALVIAALITIIFLMISLGASGTWLDPRVWTGEYVPGDTIASSMNNATWLINAATSSSPYVFTVAWLTLSIVYILSRKLKEKGTQP